MRKLHPSLETPVDNMIYIVVEKIAPFAHTKIGLTANMITTIANILGVLSIYFVFQYQFILSSIFWFLSYMGDCLDGYVARKYNHANIFGDYYDHISDKIRYILIFGSLYKINPGIFFSILPYLIIIIILGILHLACQETIHGGNKSPMLYAWKYIFSFVCKNNAESIIKYTKYFGMGTLNLFISILILYYGYSYYKPNNLTDKNGLETDENEYISDEVPL